MSLIGGNPDHLRDDLREAAKLANAELRVREAEAALEAALNPPPFDPQKIADDVRSRW